MKYNLFLIIIPKMVAPLCYSIKKGIWLNTFFTDKNVLGTTSGAAPPGVNIFPAPFPVINSK